MKKSAERKKKVWSGVLIATLVLYVVLGAVTCLVYANDTGLIEIKNPFEKAPTVTLNKKPYEVTQSLQEDDRADEGQDSPANVGDGTAGAARLTE